MSIFKRKNENGFSKDNLKQGIKDIEASYAALRGVEENFKHFLLVLKEGNVGIEFFMKKYEELYTQYVNLCKTIYNKYDTIADDIDLKKDLLPSNINELALKFWVSYMDFNSRKERIQPTIDEINAILKDKLNEKGDNQPGK